MSGSARVRDDDAWRKITAQRQAARRTQSRRRLLLAGGSVVVVLVVLAVFILVKALRSSPGGTAESATGTALPAGVISRITSVPPATLIDVSTGTTAAGSAPSPGCTASIPRPPTSTPASPP